MEKYLDKCLIVTTWRRDYESSHKYWIIMFIVDCRGLARAFATLSWIWLYTFKSFTFVNSLSSWMWLFRNGTCIYIFHIFTFLFFFILLAFVFALQVCCHQLLLIHWRVMQLCVYSIISIMFSLILFPSCLIHSINKYDPSPLLLSLHLCAC